MQKDKGQLDLLWQFTHPIDSWILEHITFHKNGWGQQVQIGSVITHLHTDDDDCDIIRYDRNPGHIGDEDDNDALFIIYFYASHALFALYDRREDHEYRIRLTYEEPTMFDKLESMIWNARTIDYIYSDLNAMEQNMRLIRDAMWEEPQKMIRRSIGDLGGIFKRIEELGTHVRNTTRTFVRREQLVRGIHTADSQERFIDGPDPDEIPF